MLAMCEYRVCSCKRKRESDERSFHADIPTTDEGRPNITGEQLMDLESVLRVHLENVSPNKNPIQAFNSIYFSETYLQEGIKELLQAFFHVYDYRLLVFVVKTSRKQDKSKTTQL